MNIPKIENKDLYVIGDVHGCADEFHALLDKLPLEAHSGIVLVGDYIDRGPKSRDVIDTLLELKQQRDIYPLLGNHESLLLEFLGDPSPSRRARFTYNGGGATLQSYSTEPGNFSIPEEHVTFIRGLPLAFQTSSHLFVHAGLPSVPISELNAEKHRKTLLWVRREFHASTYQWDKVVVHGHSRVAEVYRDERRINVDTGCVYSGKLSALHVPSGRIYQVPRTVSFRHEFLRDSPSSRREAVRFDGQLDIVFTEPEGLPAFQTVNYSDFGVLVECPTKPEEHLLALHAQVVGTLLPRDDSVNINFRGDVVRIDEVAHRNRYAIRFDAPVKASE